MCRAADLYASLTAFWPTRMRHMFLSTLQHCFGPFKQQQSCLETPHLHTAFVWPLSCRPCRPGQPALLPGPAGAGGSGGPCTALQVARCLWPIRWTVALLWVATEWCFYAFYFRRTYEEFNKIPADCKPKGAQLAAAAAYTAFTAFLEIFYSSIPCCAAAGTFQWLHLLRSARDACVPRAATVQQHC